MSISPAYLYAAPAIAAAINGIVMNTFSPRRPTVHKYRKVKSRFPPLPTGRQKRNRQIILKVNELRERLESRFVPPKTLEGAATFRDFNPTLGYPGEGPPKKSKKKDSQSNPRLGPNKKKTSELRSMRNAEVKSVSLMPGSGFGSGQMFGAPTSVGYRQGPASFNLSSNYQKLTQISGPGKSSTLGVRVTGTDIFSAAYLATPRSNSSILFYNTTSSGQQSTMAVSPGRISSRLLQQETIYQYYAIRRLVIRYVPNVTPDILNLGGSGGTTAWSGATAFALGVQQSIDSNLAPTNALQLFSAIREYNPSFTTSFWLPASMEYVYNGVQLWEIDATVETDPEQLAQFELYASANSNLNASSGYQQTTLGYLEMDYVIDFYCPTAAQQTPQLMAIQRSLRGLSDDDLLTVRKFVNSCHKESKREQKTYKPTSSIVNGREVVKMPWSGGVVDVDVEQGIRDGSLPSDFPRLTDSPVLVSRPPPLKKS